jgi:hypothetical protein
MWGIISGIAITTICRIFSYVTKRLRINVDENKPEIRAGTILMYFFGNTFSQGKFYLKLIIGFIKSLVHAFTCSRVFFCCLCFRELFSVPTTIAETSRCDLVFRYFRLRQHLQLDSDVLHVGDLSKTRSQFHS